MYRFSRFALAAVLTLMASLVAIPSSGAMITSTPGVHDWLFDTSGRGGVDTQSEAVTVAKRYDVVIAAQRYQPFLGAMKQAKPGIVVALYHKGTSVFGSDFTWIKNNHPGWLLRTKGGNLLKSSWGTYLIDPGSNGYHPREALRMPGIVPVSDVLRIVGPHAATIQKVIPEAILLPTERALLQNSPKAVEDYVLDMKAPTKRRSKRRSKPPE